MTLWLAPDPLIVASRSRVRRALLTAAAIAVEVIPADIDERAIESGEGAGTRKPSDTALLLSREKALAIARAKPDRIVLGADQTLALGDRQLHKPDGRAGAAAQLRMLSGRSHSLHSAVAVVQAEQVLFAHVAVATLTVRDFTNDFLERYLDEAGDDVLHSVGAYQLEGKGSHLFASVDGDYFTVLGLPLLPLLEFFRQQGWVAA